MTAAASAVVDPAVLYNLIQMSVYAVMAIMIMRLKLFWSPQLCIVSGLVASEKVSTIDELYNLLLLIKDLILFLLQLLRPIHKRRDYQLAIIFALFACMSYQGIQNIQQQRNIKGK